MGRASIEIQYPKHIFEYHEAVNTRLNHRVSGVDVSHRSGAENSTIYVELSDMTEEQMKDRWKIVREVLLKICGERNVIVPRNEELRAPLSQPEKKTDDGEMEASRSRQLSKEQKNRKNKRRGW